MSREKELVKNTIVLGLGKFLPRIVGLVTLPIVTEKLTKGEYGTYDLVLTLIMLLMPIATLQIQSAAFRYLIDCRQDQKKCSDIISSILTVTVSIATIVSIVFLLVVQNITFLTRFIIVLYFFVDIIYTTISQITRGLGYNKIYSISSIVLSVVNGAGVVALVSIIQLGLNGVLLSLVIANIASIAYLSIRTKLTKYYRVSLFDVKLLKEMVGYSWPMIPNNLSTWVLKLSDRLVITSFLGIEANAEYAVANKIPNLLSIAQSVFVMAWQENASLAVSDKNVKEYYSKMFDKIFCLMIGFTGLLIAFTPLMFSILIRGDYDDAYIQMPILILGMFFYCMSAFQGGIYIAHKKTKSVGMTTVIAAGINLAVDFLLVNKIGITAGSLSSLVAYLALYIYRLWDVRKIQDMEYKILKQIIYVALIIVMLVLCSMREFRANVLNYVLSVCLFLFANRELIVGVIKKKKK